MNTMLLTMITLVLAIGPDAYAQNMAEYSTLPTTSTTASNAIAATSRGVAKKAATLNAAVSQSPPKGSASPEKSAANHNQTIPGPDSPAVFVLSNGERLESSHYLLTVTSLRLQQGETQRTIPLSAVNVDATIAANRERGIDLKIPHNKAEIMLSF